jgi:RNA polymerase sigma-B factor
MRTQPTADEQPGQDASHHAGPCALALRWQQDGDRHARRELFEQFVPLARRLAGRYASPREPMEDLVQVAYVGLLGAVDRFDPQRGRNFTAFAIPTILGELRRYFRDTGWTAHVPRGAQELAMRIDRGSREITERTGRTPRVGELAEYLEISMEDAIAGLHAATAHYSVSLDAPAPGADTEDQTLVESLGVEDERFGLVDAKLSLPSALARLPYMERQVVTLRLTQGLKQMEIARQMGCSQMQVSRLLRRGTTHLRDLVSSELDSRHTV